MTVFSSSFSIPNLYISGVAANPSVSLWELQTSMAFLWNMKSVTVSFYSTLQFSSHNYARLGAQLTRDHWCTVRQRHLSGDFFLYRWLCQLSTALQGHRAQVELDSIQGDRAHLHTWIMSAQDKPPSSPWDLFYWNIHFWHILCRSLWNSATKCTKKWLNTAAPYSLITMGIKL